MTVVKINAITVAPAAGMSWPGVSRPGPVRSTARMVSRVFELLKPADGRDTWLVVDPVAGRGRLCGLAELTGVRARPPLGG
jgi:hypothetical protein